MNNPLDFQSIILSLQHFWADYGCMLWQPYYTQVGAGTMNPATYLRALGPEPWNVAYVEPSIRPDDARYGENPNRLQQHYQFQVILKPDPGNPQDLYLKSLQAIGIDPRQHDIRFVEDVWEQPAVGAWGLGWEVWLDGQEITQYTYFQQVGGQLCDPVSVELTYGLDRIAISLQRVRGFQEIHWNDEIKYGDVNLLAEQEHSKYYFEIANVERLRQMYNLFEEEAKACLEKGLVLPAHDYILKCSHTFNVLDTRGAIGVTERQAYFGRMRELARQNSLLYLEQRQRMEYPFLKNETTEKVVNNSTKFLRASTKISPPPVFDEDQLTYAPFLLEIGTEELPVGDLNRALQSIELNFKSMILENYKLDYKNLKVFGTPRRLVVYVEHLMKSGGSISEEIKGPPESISFDTFDQPTKALIGWAKKYGIPDDFLTRAHLVREIGGGRYVVWSIVKPGLPVIDLLPKYIEELFSYIKFDKPIRWNDSNVYFSRPIRWLLALYGDQVVDFAYASVRSGNITRGLRFHEPEQLQVKSAGEYFTYLRSQGILLDTVERRRTIQEQIEKLAKQVNGTILPDEALLDEVTNLVEAPTALLGSFDPASLNLPVEVLVSVMKKHQRYFAIQKPGGEGGLLPYFITVRNGDDQGLDIVREGNEHVLRARFADAAFFVREDVKHHLEDATPRLATLTFQEKVGTMKQKADKIETLIGTFGSNFPLTREEEKVARRAALLCKNDLVTKMVVEMTSLQGVMGRFYALRSGESQAVADAIYEHYLPRTAGDEYPKTRAGIAVGLADRLVTLTGLFSVGLVPTGAKDPFALRRTAIGMLLILITRDIDFDLDRGLTQAWINWSIDPRSENILICKQFIIERLRNILLEEKWRYDVVNAVLAAQGNNPARAARAVRQLTDWVNRPDWNTILPAYARCVRITRDQTQRYEVDPLVFTEPGEGGLYAALQTAKASPHAPGSADEMLNAFLPMIPAINRFFDEVLVMAEDPKLRSNRLGLLQRIAALAEGVADFSKLEGF